jgi:transcriptional regulator with XRE-family HTH domain
MINSGIGERIKQVRVFYNLKQKDFAKELDVTPPYISMVENDREIPTDMLLKLISYAYKVSFDWLKTGEGKMIIDEDDEIISDECEEILMSVSDKFNKILTHDNMPIRSRVTHLHELFVNMIDLRRGTQEEQMKYLDICYKFLYHVNSYLSFEKKSLENRQMQYLPFPDDVLYSLKNDIAEFEQFFKPYHLPLL